MNDDIKEMNKNGSLSEKPLRTLKSITIAVYALQGLSFFFGITSIIAVVINYLKREEVRGTWLASHFRWQITTFWISLLFGIIGTVTTFLGIGYVILLATYLWVIYRIVKGALRLKESKEI